MDVTPRVDHILAKAVDEQVSEQRLIREALEDIAARLEQVELNTADMADKIGPWSDPGAATADLAVRVEKRVALRFAALDDRIDEIAEVIERRAVDTMSAELVEVADELRRAVGELGRLLVRDRGRISSALTSHRNAILAELRMPATPPEPDIDLADEPEESNGESKGPVHRVLRRLYV